MLVPGSNLLNMALGVIGSQAVEWHRFAGRTTNAAGYDVATFDDPVTIQGSLQPASNTLLQQLGLDWTKNYMTFYARASFFEPSRDKTGDRFVYAGRTYTVESNVDWFAQDGWTSVLCVEMTNA